MKIKQVAFTLIFVAFFSAGLGMGFSYTPAKSAPMVAAPSLSERQVETIQLSEQLNVLVIGVEEVGATETRLKSIWLILVPPGSGDLTFMPIYPQPAGMAGEAYAEPHEPIMVDARSVESATIIRLLADQNTWWHEVVLVDEAGLVGMLKLLGGMDMYSEPLAGILDTNGAPKAWEQPQAAHENQMALLKSLCGQSNTFAQLLLPGAFMRPDTAHFQTSSNHVDLFNVLYSISIKISITGFVCQFPSLN